MAKKKSQNKLIKFIAASVGIILVGCSIAWYAGMQKIKEVDLKAKETFEKEGFIIDRTEPTYSGFPFKITQNTTALQGIFKKADSTIVISGKNVKASAWIFNPGHIELTGDMLVSINQNGKVTTTMSFEKASTNISLDKDGALIQKGWQIDDLSIFSGTFSDDDKKAVIKVKEISSESDTNRKGGNTELKNTLILKKFEIATKSATPIVVDKVKIKGAIVSKFKTYEALRMALNAMDKDLSQRINESCKSKTGTLPPVGDLVKELEDTKANASGEIEIKMGDFKLEFDTDFSVKDGFPELDAKLVLDDFDKMTKSMVDAGTLEASSEQMVRLSLSAVAERDAKEGDYVIKASLKDRKLKLGENQIREFKKIDWNNIPVPDDFCQKYQTAEDETKGMMLRGLTPYVSYPVF